MEPKGLLSDVKKGLEEFVEKINELEEFKDGWIDPITSTVVDMDKLVDKASEKAAGGLSAIIRKTRKNMFEEINSIVDDGLDFLDPDHLIKNLEIKKQKDRIYCLIENVLKGLKNVISDFLKEMLGKIVNLPLCALENLLGGILSKVTDMIQNAIKGPLASLAKLAGTTMPNFSDMMNKALDFAQAGIALLE